MSPEVAAVTSVAPRSARGGGPRPRRSCPPNRVTTRCVAVTGSKTRGQGVPREETLVLDQPGFGLSGGFTRALQGGGRSPKWTVGAGSLVMPGPTGNPPPRSVAAAGQCRFGNSAVVFSSRAVNERLRGRQSRERPCPTAELNEPVVRAENLRAMPLRETGEHAGMAARRAVVRVTAGVNLSFRPGNARQSNPAAGGPRCDSFSTNARRGHEQIRDQRDRRTSCAAGPSTIRCRTPEPSTDFSAASRGPEIRADRRARSSSTPDDRESPWASGGNYRSPWKVIFNENPSSTSPRWFQRDPLAPQPTSSRASRDLGLGVMFSSETLPKEPEACWDSP